MTENLLKSINLEKVIAGELNIGVLEGGERMANFLPRLPIFGGMGGERSGAGAPSSWPQTLKEDPKRKSVFAYYVADPMSPECVGSHLAKQYPLMRFDHIASVVRAIEVRRAAKTTTNGQVQTDQDSALTSSEPKV